MARYPKDQKIYSLIHSNSLVRSMFKKRLMIAAVEEGKWTKASYGRMEAK